MSYPPFLDKKNKMQRFLSFIKINGVKKSSKKKNSRNQLHRELSSLIDVPSPSYSRLSISHIEPSNFENCDQPLIRLILSNQKLHTMFIEHAKNEYNEESIKFWDAIQRYRKADNFEFRQQMAHHIYNTFLAPEAVTDVNVKEGTKQHVWEDIENGLLTEWLFDDLELEVEECLADIYGRFCLSDEYIEFMENHGIDQKKKGARSEPSSSCPQSPSLLSYDSSTPRRMSISPRDLLCGLKK